ncbi:MULTISPECIES: acyltransferase family protein [Niastella]|uniref:Acyltransferase n=1 Tax=Niastella soli TaxID=2821487 RepID=A0ABS3Z365_9BACT|nr:acyltransferase [Niastella soli]MBO9204604.1 acyltransferase [Niastella soli]
MKLNSIQFLRAVAALLVVYEHSMDIQKEHDISLQQKFYHLEHFGCIGVDIFFVISGFIITYIAHDTKGTQEAWLFLKRRFYRINPIYYIASLIYAGVILLQLLFYKVELTNYFIDLTRSLPDTLLIFPVTHDAHFFTPLLIVGWTLSFEWLFYILFFTVLLLNVKYKPIYLCAVIILLISIGQLTQPHDLRLQFITNPIMLEFVMGIIICQLYLKNTHIPVWAATACLLAGLITYALIIRFGFGNIWNYELTINGHSSFKKFFFWGLPSCCIVAGCVFIEKKGRLSSLFNYKWALLLGDASYSIYLTHISVFWALTILYEKTTIFWKGDVMIWLQLAVAILFAIGFYKLVEKPLLRQLYFSQKTKAEIKQPIISISKTV